MLLCDSIFLVVNPGTSFLLGYLLSSYFLVLFMIKIGVCEWGWEMEIAFGNAYMIEI